MGFQGLSVELSPFATQARGCPVPHDPSDTQNLLTPNSDPILPNIFNRSKNGTSQPTAQEKENINKSPKSYCSRGM